MLDLVIRDALVVDGTGAEPRRGAVGVRDGTIVAIGDVEEPAARAIAADGLALAPGFVDIHTHYDAQVMWDPWVTPSPLHGVTTVIGGNCGFTVAPCGPEHVEYLIALLARVEGMPPSALSEGLDWEWRSYADWLDRLEGRLGVNVGFLVGHSTLRRAVLGDDATERTADRSEILRMAEMLGAALDAGGLGLSSSLAATHHDGRGRPVPSRAATHHELVALAAEVARHRGTTVELIPPIGATDDETLAKLAEISRVADRPVNWNLLLVDAARRDALDAHLGLSDRAEQQGGRLVALTLPEPLTIRMNVRAGFTLDSLPGWAPFIALPVDERMRRLRDPSTRAELAGAPARRYAGTSADDYWSNLTVAEVFAPANAPHQGRTVGEVASTLGVAPFDAFCELTLADELRTGFVPPAFGGDDDESWRLRAEIWQDDRTVVGGSDAGAHLDMSFQADYATVLLETGVRERRLLPLEAAVRELTDVPARLYGLRDRGRIAEGYMADLVLFDPDRIGPTPPRTVADLPAGAERLYAAARGIQEVLVAGTTIVRDGELTDALPGRLLRSGRDTDTVTAARETPR